MAPSTRRSLRGGDGFQCKVCLLKLPSKADLFDHVETHNANKNSPSPKKKASSKSAKETPSSHIKVKGKGKKNKGQEEVASDKKSVDKKESEKKSIPEEKTGVEPDPDENDKAVRVEKDETNDLPKPPKQLKCSDKVEHVRHRIIVTTRNPMAGIEKGKDDGVMGMENDTTNNAPIEDLQTNDGKRKRPPQSTTWMCPYCGKGHTSNWNLQLHIRVHTGEKPFLCPNNLSTGCTAAFTAKQGLQRHLQQGLCGPSLASTNGEGALGDDKGEVGSEGSFGSLWGSLSMDMEEEEGIDSFVGNVQKVPSIPFVNSPRKLPNFLNAKKLRRIQNLVKPLQSEREGEGGVGDTTPKRIGIESHTQGEIKNKRKAGDNFIEDKNGTSALGGNSFDRDPASPDQKKRGSQIPTTTNTKGKVPELLPIPRNKVPPKVRKPLVKPGEERSPSPEDSEGGGILIRNIASLQEDNPSEEEDEDVIDNSDKCEVVLEEQDPRPPPPKVRIISQDNLKHLLRGGAVPAFVLLENEDESAAKKVPSILRKRKAGNSSSLGVRLQLSSPPSSPSVTATATKSPNKESAGMTASSLIRSKGVNEKEKEKVAEKPSEETEQEVSEKNTENDQNPGQKRARFTPLRRENLSDCSGSTAQSFTNIAYQTVVKKEPGNKSADVVFLDDDSCNMERSLTCSEVMKSEEEEMMESSSPPHRQNEDDEDTFVPATGTFRRRRRKKGSSDNQFINGIYPQIDQSCLSEDNTQCSQLYPCPHCPETFVFELNLIKHVEGHGGKFPCVYCKATFKIRSQLVSHRIRVHGEEMGARECPLCRQLVASGTELDNHLVIYHSDKTAGGRTAKEYYLATARRVPRTEMGATGVVEKETETEMREAQPGEFELIQVPEGIEIDEVEVEEDAYKCDSCAAAFSSLLILEEHRKTHKEDKMGERRRVDGPIIPPLVRRRGPGRPPKGGYFNSTTSLPETTATTISQYTFQPLLINRGGRISSVPRIGRGTGRNLVRIVNGQMQPLTKEMLAGMKIAPAGKLPLPQTTQAPPARVPQQQNQNQSQASNTTTPTLSSQPVGTTRNILLRSKSGKVMQLAVATSADGTSTGALIEPSPNPVIKSTTTVTVPSNSTPTNVRPPTPKDAVSASMTTSSATSASSLRLSKGQEHIRKVPPASTIVRPPLTKNAFPTSHLHSSQGPRLLRKVPPTSTIVRPPPKDALTSSTSSSFSTNSSASQGLRYIRKVAPTSTIVRPPVSTIVNHPQNSSLPRGPGLLRKVPPTSTIVRPPGSTFVSQNHPLPNTLSATNAFLPRGPGLLRKVPPPSTIVRPEQATGTNDGKPFQCDLCPAKWQSHKGLQMHMRMGHGELLDNLTPTWPQLLPPLPPELQGPIPLGVTLPDFPDGDGKFQCPLCSESFTQRNNLKTHVRSHGPGKKCAFCEGTFTHLGAVIRHRQRAHANEGTTESTTCLRCAACGLNLASERALRHHNTLYHQRDMQEQNALLEEMDFDDKFNAIGFGGDNTLFTPDVILTEGNDEAEGTLRNSVDHDDMAEFLRRPEMLRWRKEVMEKVNKKLAETLKENPDNENVRARLNRVNNN